ncbi:MAG TPA: bestrophin family protein [Bacteroidia bacterium]|nr:bestrophin family protein [Bacteroidia bacterium]
MKAYNPRHWFKLIFNFHKSDSIRLLIPAIVGLGLFSACISYLQVEGYVHLRNTMVMHSLLGFVISLLLVFRTNTAYDRWWEGRRLWGDLVNNSRNLMLKIAAFLPEKEKERKKMFGVLISNFAFALKEHLRGGYKEEELQEHTHLRFSELKTAKHIPNRISLQLFKEADRLVKDGLITEERFLSISDELRSFINITGGCERIRKTPIPYSYSSFIKRVILLYVITLPLGLTADLKWASIPIVLFIFYAFAGLELIAEEIEDPFGLERNDLPIDDLAQTIKRNIAEINDFC